MGCIVYKIESKNVSPKDKIFYPDDTEVGYVYQSIGTNIRYLRVYNDCVDRILFLNLNSSRIEESSFGVNGSTQLKLIGSATKIIVEYRNL